MANDRYCRQPGVRHRVSALPDDKITGTNKDYAGTLLELAVKLKFPDPYLDQIRRAFG